MSEQYHRLSDKVLEALELSLAQKDVAISELLCRSLEMAMTRGAGGKGFVERREFSDAVEKALQRLSELKKGG